MFTRNTFGSIVAAIFFCTYPVVTYAADDAAEVIELVERARGQFRPISQQQFRDSKNTLTKNLDALRRYLLSADASIAASWFKYLEWDSLRAELGKAGGPDALVLQRILSRYFASYIGLEREAFLRVREALRQYRGLSRVYYSPDAAQEYERRLDTIRHLAARGPLAQIDIESLQAMMHAYEWLVEANQAKALTDRLGTVFGKGNIQLHLGAEILQDIGAVGIDEIQPVSEQMLGSRVSGQARVKASGQIKFYPNPRTADVRLDLAGQINASSVARQRRVAVYSTSVTSIDAHKSFSFNDSGFVGLPTQIQCRTRSHIQSVRAPLLIRRAAMRRAHGMLPEAEELTSRRAAQQVGARVDAQAAGSLLRFNEFFATKIRVPLLRLGFGSLVHSSYTTADALRLALKVARQTDFAAPTAPSGLSGESQIEVAMHESAVANVLALLLGGLTINSDELAKLGASLLEHSEELFAGGANLTGWQLQLARDNPLLLHFEADNQIAVSVNVRRFAAQRRDRAEDFVAEDFRLQLRYKFGAEEFGWSLARDGDVRLVSRRPIDPSMIAAILENARDFFAEYVEIQKDLIPEDVFLAKLVLREISTERGWIKIGANHTRRD